jgi:hypothetical protein
LTVEPHCRSEIRANAGDQADTLDTCPQSAASGLLLDDFAPLQFRDLAGAEAEFGEDFLGLLAELWRRRHHLAGGA